MSEQKINLDKIEVLVSKEYFVNYLRQRLNPYLLNSNLPITAFYKGFVLVLNYMLGLQVKFASDFNKVPLRNVIIAIEALHWDLQLDKIKAIYINLTENSSLSFYDPELARGARECLETLLNLNNSNKD